MAHALEALLGGPGFKPTGFGRVELAQGFVMLPLGTEAMERLGSTRAKSRPDFLELTSEVEQLASDCSEGAKVVYVHSEFHGGTGFQAALGWFDGTVAFGPCLTANHASECQTDNYRQIGRADTAGAVNQALRFLGARAQRGLDEFDSLGLGEGWTEDFVRRASQPS